MKRATMLLALLMVLPFTLVQAAPLDEGIKQIQHDWAVAKYQTPEDQQDKAFTALTARAETLNQQYPDRAEPKIWQAIVESTHAGVSGGLGALGKVKHARSLLEAAEKQDATALQGSIYTSLGSLYYQVPGWPIGFGDDDKAEQYLKKALAINPEGIDANFFYGDFLREDGRYQEATQYLEKALNAPARADRPIADAGRRGEARELLAKVKETLAENSYSE